MLQLPRVEESNFNVGNVANEARGGLEVGIVFRRGEDDLSELLHGEIRVVDLNGLLPHIIGRPIVNFHLTRDVGETDCKEVPGVGLVGNIQKPFYFHITIS